MSSLTSVPRSHSETRLLRLGLLAVTHGVIVAWDEYLRLTGETPVPLGH